MSLSAKERILRLRETEYKLQRLQNDLLNGNDSNSASMSDFLNHHKELMALPSSTRDSVPFRFSFEAPGRYMEVKQTQKLTLPPKIPAKSVSKLKPFKDQLELDDLENRNTSTYKVWLAGHRSLALQSLLNELDEQTSKLTRAFPKLDMGLVNKTPFLKGFRKMNKQSSKSTKSIKVGSSQPSAKGNLKKKFSPTMSSKSWLKPSVADSKSKKVKLMWNNELSETPSTTTASELLVSNNDEDNMDMTYEKFSKMENKLAAKESQELREVVAYALGTSMGVILPPSSTQVSSRRGPNGWNERKASDPSSLTGINNNGGPGTKGEVEENDNISAKEAVTILRRRKFPERKNLFPKNPSPEERGLIGVEISNFEPQCAFFYRDRNGNYNPHLHHSKQVQESMKDGKFGWKQRSKHASS